MARPAQSRQKKVSRSVEYMTNRKHLGDEPILEKDSYDPIKYLKALTWYSYMGTKEEAREYLEHYLKQRGRIADIKLLKKVPDDRFIDQAGWIARLITRGALLHSNAEQKIDKRIQEMLPHARVERVQKEQKETVSVQDRIKDKISDFIALCEQQIDKVGHSTSIYDMLNHNQIPASLTAKIKEHFQPIHDEAIQLHKRGCDPSLKEGYGGFTQPQLIERANFYRAVMADLERYGKTHKKQRKVRQKKPASVDKKLKFFKPQAQSKEYEIQSIASQKVVGAEELWTFNTKYKTVTRFVQKDRAGLDVQRTAIQNYDEAASKTYRTGRKTKEILKQITGGKRAAQKAVDGLTEAPLQYRINENTILVKVN